MASPIKSPLASEPVITVTTITTAVSVALSAAVAFGLDLSDDQRNAILGLIGALYPIVTVVWARSKVYAPDTVTKMVDDAHFAGQVGMDKPAIPGKGKAG